MKKDKTRDQKLGTHPLLEQKDQIFNSQSLPAADKIHHCRYHEYKNYLKEGEEQIGDLLGRIENALTIIK